MLIQEVFSVSEEVPVHCYLSCELLLLRLLSYKPISSCTIEKLFYRTKEKGCIFSDCRFFLQMLAKYEHIVLHSVKKVQYLALKSISMSPQKNNEQDINHKIKNI